MITKDDIAKAMHDEIIRQSDPDDALTQYDKLSAPAQKLLLDMAGSVLAAIKAADCKIVPKEMTRWMWTAWEDADDVTAEWVAMLDAAPEVQ